MVLIHLSCALKKTRMEIEDITWVSLTTGRSSEKKGHLTVCDGLFGKIVIDNESVLSVVTEIFTNGASGVWSQELKRSGVRCGSGNNDGVLHAVSLLEEAANVGYGGSLLANSDVDAVEGLGVVTSLEDSLLVDDGVNGNGGLAGLSVTNDQFTLTSANRHLLNSIDQELTTCRFIIYI